MEERRGRCSETSPGEKRGNKPGKAVIILQGRVEPAKQRQLIGLVDEPRESCADATWNETRIEPRQHLDASRAALLAIICYFRVLCCMLARLAFVLF